MATGTSISLYTRVQHHELGVSNSAILATPTINFDNNDMIDLKTARYMGDMHSYTFVEMQIFFSVVLGAIQFLSHPILRENEKGAKMRITSIQLLRAGDFDKKFTYRRHL